MRILALAARLVLSGVPLLPPATAIDCDAPADAAEWAACVVLSTPGQVDWCSTYYERCVTQFVCMGPSITKPCMLLHALLP